MTAETWHSQNDVLSLILLPSPRKATFLQCLDNEEQEVTWSAYEVHAALDISSVTPSEKLATELVLWS